jgi:hypothetical protein
MKRVRVLGLALLALCACGGGGGGGSSSPPVPPATPTPAPITQASISVPTSTSSAATETYAITGYFDTVVFPTSSVATTLSTTFSLSQPTGTPTIQALHRRPQTIGSSSIVPIAFLCMTPAVTTTLTSYPATTAFAVPNGSATANAYVAAYDPAHAANGWTTVAGPATVTGQQLSFSQTSPGLTLTAGQAFCLLYFTTASALPTPTPTPSPKPVTAVQTTIVTSSTGPTTTTYALTGVNATVTIPSTDTPAMISTTFTLAQPSGMPALQSVRRGRSSIGVAPSATVGYYCMQPAASATLSAFPTFSVTTAGGAAGVGYVALFNPVAPTAGWIMLDGPASPSTPAGGGASLAFTGAAQGPTVQIGVNYCYAIFTVPAPIATPAPSPVATTAAGVPAWTATQHTGYVAYDYGSSIAIYAPGQSTPSATLPYNGWQLYFDSAANLVVATSNSVLRFAPGATTPTTTYPAQGGFSLAIDGLGDIAVGGYNMGPTVAVYPGGVASAIYRVPGQPSFSGLALSPTGELAVPTSTGDLMTFPRGSTTSNRTIPLHIGTFNEITVAYDGNGNLATTTDLYSDALAIYPPGATTPSVTIPYAYYVIGMVFDAANNLLVEGGGRLTVYAHGSSNVLGRIQDTPGYSAGVGNYVAVDPVGNIATTSGYYKNDGRVFPYPFANGEEGITISP